jgi:hypothetical protein
MSIAVLNGMHFDEWPSDRADELLEGFRDHPAVKVFSRERPPGVFARGYDANIMDCFPGNPNGNREERDAYAIAQFCRGARLVWDIHGSKQPGDYPVYSSRNSSPLVAGVASLLESKYANVLDFDDEPIVRALPNYLVWDLAPNSPALERIPEILERLVDGWVPPSRPMREIRYTGTATLARVVELGLPMQYPRHTVLSDSVAEALGLPAPLVVICWDAQLYGHTGYIGELGTPV